MEQPASKDQNLSPDSATFDDREAALRCTQAWDALAKLYSGRIEVLAGRPREQASLLLRLGKLRELQLSDPEAAVAAYREAAGLDAEDPAPLERLRLLHRGRGDTAMVLQIAEAELARTRDPKACVRLLEESAEIWERELGDAEEAQKLRDRALALGAEAAAEPAGPEVPDGPEAPDPPQAIEAVSPAQRAWLAAARGNANEAIETLGAALMADPEDVEAIDMMITVLEGAERHADTAEWLERRVDLAKGETRAVVLTRLARAREDLGDLGAARAAYEQALDAQPRNASARTALARIYRATEAWTRLRLLLEQSAEQGSAEQRVDAFDALGLLLENQFEDPDAAARAYEHALALAPSDTRAGEGLARLGGGPAPGDEAASPGPDTSRPLRILGVLERKLAARGGRGERQKTDLRLRIAQLKKQTLDDPQGAIEILEPALESETGCRAVAGLLAELYEATSRHEALVELAERLADLVDTPEERIHWLRRAAVTSRAAGRADLAIACCQRILEEQPSEPETELMLQDLYRARGDAAPLARLLRQSLAHADAERERAIHAELAAHLEGPLDDPCGAFMHITRAVELDPSDMELLDRAMALASLVGGELSQLDLLDQAAAAASDSQVRARVLVRRASHLADTLGWNEEALDGWKTVATLDPSCEEAALRLARV